MCPGEVHDLHHACAARRFRGRPGCARRAARGEPHALARVGEKLAAFRVGCGDVLQQRGVGLGVRARAPRNIFSPGFFATWINGPDTMMRYAPQTRIDAGGLPGQTLAVAPARRATVLHHARGRDPSRRSTSHRRRRTQAPPGTRDSLATRIYRRYNSSPSVSSGRSI